METPRDKSTDRDAARPPGMRGVVVRGMALFGLASLAAKFSSLAAQMVLARVLTPVEFGIAAVGVGLASLVTIVAPLNLTDILVQRGDRLESMARQARRLAIFAGLVMSIAILIAGVLAQYRNPEPPSVDARLSAELVESVAVNPPRILIQGDERPARALDPGAIDGGPSIDLRSRIDRLVEEAGGGTLIAENGTGAAVLDAAGLPYRSIPLMLVLAVIAARPLGIALQVVSAALLRRDLRFARLSMTRAVCDLLALATAITVGLVFRNAVALVVAPSVAAVLVALAILPAARTKSVSQETDSALLPDFLRVSLGQWIHNCGYFVPLTILGLLMSETEVGVYYFGFMLALQVNMILSNLLVAPLLPVLSRLADEPERFDESVRRAQSVLFAFSLPSCLAIGLVLPWVVPLVFGERWIPAVGVATILFLAQAFGITIAIANAALKARGRFGLWTAWHAVLTTLLLLAAWVGGSSKDIETVALLTLVAYVLGVPIGLALSSHRPRWRGVVRDLAIGVIAATPFGLLHLARLELGTGVSGLLTVAIGLPASGAVYLGVLRILDRPRFDLILELGSRVVPQRWRIGRGV